MNRFVIATRPSGPCPFRAPALQQLLERLRELPDPLRGHQTTAQKISPPAGTLITADAMHCQQESARFITQELGGDFLFGLKGNQSGVLDKAERLLAQQDLSKPKDPPSLEIGYCASSLEIKQFDDAQLLEIIRGHWAAIETGTPCRRNVTLGEDACRTKDRNGAEALTCLRNLRQWGLRTGSGKGAYHGQHPELLVPATNLLKRLENPQSIGNRPTENELKDPPLSRKDI